jgi:hypothetical protein
MHTIRFSSWHSSENGNGQSVEQPSWKGDSNGTYNRVDAPRVRTEFVLNQKVHIWLALEGGPADGIVVTWKQGEKACETKLSVGGTTWHTWAYKTAAVAGPWEVTVADAAGNVLKKLAFTVGPK